ncbi:hypothetical protein EMIHUDRAFT_210925 [Emiliania huxleyi CCMP1516]|uniref:Uncharacterized protein n=2 Tax=Emiliania huxleyi TaxID=2903 RepID=A0A0D3IXI3_EMIH1|nr:hypothetical protein EMIHUDRAFT_210925 [Emiliania huxleyi CCMP1516]EOD15968.1 hypothetical protein EMIHUDRAFT_210925 [Emiliania huxleyi CCMP1516]|eukprot:XP_005768397.1 hypothetical protein EMIHUDRAFT_210925 [Emiliania huxleyi CCMP1516]
MRSDPKGTLLFHFGSITGDAENINKQARPVRTNWIKNKQAANGLSFGLEQALAPSPTDGSHGRAVSKNFGSLRACRMLCDVWTLARNARKLAFHPCARGRTAVVGSLCDAPIGSSTSSPATSQHGSSLDGSLPSALLAFCTASPSSL